MQTEKAFAKHSLVKRDFLKPMAIGGLIGFTLILLFLISAGSGNPEWPKLWPLKPLIIVPLAGATGGAFYQYMDVVRRKGGWHKIAADFISLIVFILGLWIGSVLGLNGTYWN